MKCDPIGRLPVTRAYALSAKRCAGTRIQTDRRFKITWQNKAAALNAAQTVVFITVGTTDATESRLRKDRNMAAPAGNTNSNKNNRLWADTIRRAVVQADGAKLRAIADALIQKAAEGDIQAIKELGDRLDGKAAQAVIHAGDEDGGPIRGEVTINFVRPKS